MITAAIAIAQAACATSDESGRARPSVVAASTAVEGPTTTAEEQPPARDTTATDGQLPAERILMVELHDYAIAGDTTSVPAGRVSLAVTNSDSVPHDLVLIATALPSERLPTRGIRVDEDSADIKVLARTPTLPPAGTGSVAVVVRPGRYVLVCMVPHHYVREMMVATLVVA